jgi:hypothetical protein
MHVLSDVRDKLQNNGNSDYAMQCTSMHNAIPCTSNRSMANKEGRQKSPVHKRSEKEWTDEWTCGKGCILKKRVWNRFIKDIIKLSD